MTKPKVGDLRLWWIQPVPSKPFHFYVKNLKEAKLVYRALAAYDIHADVDSNAGGLEVYEDFDGGEWCEWTDSNGDSIDELFKTERYSN